jgi:hypothetical protein
VQHTRFRNGVQLRIGQRQKFGLSCLSLDHGGSVLSRSLLVKCHFTNRR